MVQSVGSEQGEYFEGNHKGYRGWLVGVIPRSPLKTSKEMGTVGKFPIRNASENDSPDILTGGVLQLYC